MAIESTRATAPGDELISHRGGAAATLIAAPEPGLPPYATPVVDGPDGRYELLEEIDRGGRGTVLRAHDRTLGNRWPSRSCRSGSPPGRCWRVGSSTKARIAGQLQHPGIPPVHDLGALLDGRPFLALKLIKGQTLDAMLRDRPDAAADRPGGQMLRHRDALCVSMLPTSHQQPSPSVTYLRVPGTSRSPS